MKLPNHFRKLDDASLIIVAFVCFTFCVFALVVLFYYAQRRYNLYKEIQGISRDQLWYTSYQNHFKNLKIKAMIANFIIIIILLEIANNGSIFFERILQLLDGNRKIWTILNHVRFISKYSFIPMLCMFLNVLWLAYLHSQYKYTIMRWTAYIILRIIALAILYQLISFAATSTFGHDRNWLYSKILLMFFEIFDLFSYLWYSRRFYRHLKSRRLEAKLFMSRRKYLENKYVCRHFKISTIVVAAQLAIYIFINVFPIFYLIYLILCYIGMFNYSQQIYYAHILAQWPITSCQLLYRVLFNFNYLYLIVVSAYRYWRQKRSLTRVNDRIQPLVKKYQQQIYGRCYKYY